MGVSIAGRIQLAFTKEDTGVQASIGATRVHYPPRTLTPLGPELLDLAETEADRTRVLEMRSDLVQRICQRLQKEYMSEDVQQEVIALRGIYPYRQRKGLLMLEIEKQGRRGLAALEAGERSDPASIEPSSTDALVIASQCDDTKGSVREAYQPLQSSSADRGLTGNVGGNARMGKINSDLPVPSTLLTEAVVNDEMEKKQRLLPSHSTIDDRTSQMMISTAPTIHKNSAKDTQCYSCFDFDELDELEMATATADAEKETSTCRENASEEHLGGPCGPDTETGVIDCSTCATGSADGSEGSEDSTGTAIKQGVVCSSDVDTFDVRRPGIPVPENVASDGSHAAVDGDGSAVRKRRDRLERIIKTLQTACAYLAAPDVQGRVTRLRRACRSKCEFDRMKASMLPELAFLAITSEQGVKESVSTWWAIREGTKEMFTSEHCKEQECFGQRCNLYSLLTVLPRLLDETEALSTFGCEGPLAVSRGDCVQIFGQVPGPESQTLNGRLATVVRWQEESENYEITVENGSQVFVDSSCLRKLANHELALACQARIEGIIHTEETILGRVRALRAASADERDFDCLAHPLLWKALLEPTMRRLGVDTRWFQDHRDLATAGLQADADRNAKLVESLGFRGEGSQPKRPAAWGAFASEVLGRWRYGKRNLEYILSLQPAAVSPSSSPGALILLFDGPHVSAGRVYGSLGPIGSFLEADVGTAGSEVVGRIRLRFDRSEGVMISNYMSVARREWGKDIIARRPPPGAVDNSQAKRMLTDGLGTPAIQDDAQKGSSNLEEMHWRERAVEDDRWHCILSLAVVQQDIEDHTNVDDASAESGTAGARKAHVEHLKQQQRALERYLNEGHEVSQSGKDRLFGGTEDQFNAVVQNLPSVKRARSRAMQKVGVPEEFTLAAIRFGEVLHNERRLVHEANMLTLARLRIVATPHPETLEKAALAFKDLGFFAGSPTDWFWGLDTTVHSDWAATHREVEQCWNKGCFTHWFGGPRAGRYMHTGVEELWGLGAVSLHDSAIQAIDQLQQLLKNMGAGGEHLTVENRILLAYHAEGQTLPPWEDIAGRRTCRVTLIFHLSTGHDTIADGGALRLHRSSDSSVADLPSRSSAKRGVVAEVPAAGGHWCVFNTLDFKQEITKVVQPCGRWCLVVNAVDPNAVAKLAESTARKGVDASVEVNCSVCGFAAGDGVVLPCKSEHRVCRACLQTEVRKSAVSTCPCCAGESDRVYISRDFDLFASSGLDDIGCVCPDDLVEPGARVILCGQSKSAQLNGKLAEAIWWNEKTRSWDVRVFATGQVLTMAERSMHLVEPCAAGGSLHNCPCWPSGRGVYPISLGNRCCTKLGIDECTGAIGCPGGYPYFHGQEYMPFDSILTSLDGILYFLRHNFDNFFHWNDCLDVSPRQCPHVVFKTYRSTLHAFPHHHPRKDSDKLWRRVERFRLLCRHSRDVRGARTPLFIRFVGCSEEFARIEELYSLLRLWAGPQVRLFIVSMLQTRGTRPRVQRLAKFPRVLLYLTGVVTVMDFWPIREACRLAVYDEAGLLDCPEVTQDGLISQVVPFSDPYTTESPECPETWLTPAAGKQPSFFHDCQKAQVPDQGCNGSRSLRAAVRRGDIHDVSDILSGGQSADPNCWNALGRTPLHDLCEMAGRLVGSKVAVQIAAELLLAHGDPRCKDQNGLTAFQMAIDGSPAELLAILKAAMLDFSWMDDPSVIYRALEFLGEPKRSQFARLFDVHGIRAIGPAEYLWRCPPPDESIVLAKVAEELKAFEQLPEMERKKALKRLLLEWHPDKNADRLSLATTVFQFLQAQKGSVIRR